MNLAKFCCRGFKALNESIGTVSAKFAPDMSVQVPTLLFGWIETINRFACLAES